ncbi:TPA: hypothetical protein ACH3X3_006720 [Trebouxia sp. C0006]
MDGVPSVGLEVALFDESETELEAEGSEWMDLLQVQAATLVKVHHEENPVDDCPKSQLVFGPDIRARKSLLASKTVKLHPTWSSRVYHRHALEYVLSPTQGRGSLTCLGGSLWAGYVAYLVKCPKYLPANASEA